MGERAESVTTSGYSLRAMLQECSPKCEADLWACERPSSAFNCLLNRSSVGSAYHPISLATWPRG